MGRRHHKNKFPRLRAELYSEPRKMKRWVSETIQRRISYAYPFCNESLSKLFMSTPFSSNPSRDLHWALIVFAYKVPICIDQDISQDTHPLHIKEQNRLLKMSIVSDGAIQFAEQYTKLARITNIQLLQGIIKLQALHRMHVIRDRYQYLLSMIIIVQGYFRDSLFRKKYGNTFRGVNAKVTDIQRVFRGHTVRMHQQMQERCAAIIQSTLRCYFERLDFLALTKAAKQLSSYFRVRHIRYGFLLVRQLAASIQAQVRGFLKRKQISSLRKKRLLSYRVQLFELWRRSATPLSYRAKFWKLFKQNTFLNLALHEEELARVWEVLDIKVSVTTTVYDKCKQVRISKLNTKINVNDVHIFLTLFSTLYRFNMY